MNSISLSASGKVKDITANHALNQQVTCSGQQYGNEVYRTVDGDLDTRWAVDGYGNWMQVDIGSVCAISKIEFVPYQNRAYQYKIEVSTDGINYTQVVDKTDNTSGGAMFVDTFTPVDARYIKVTITGCSGYTGTWIGICELSIY